MKDDMEKQRREILKLLAEDDWPKYPRHPGWYDDAIDTTGHVVNKDLLALPEHVDETR